jgi:hypothetical protein
MVRCHRTALVSHAWSAISKYTTTYCRSRSFKKYKKSGGSEVSACINLNKTSQLVYSNILKNNSTLTLTIMVKVDCSYLSSSTLARHSYNSTLLIVDVAIVDGYMQIIKSIKSYPCTVMLLISLVNQLTNQTYTTNNKGVN